MVDLLKTTLNSHKPEKLKGFSRALAKKKKKIENLI